MRRSWPPCRGIWWCLRRRTVCGKRARSPPRFKVETPIGEYNPDWAILLEREGVQKLYFVLETKGTTDLFDLRTGEQLKIRCGQRHFEAVGGVSLQVARSWPEFKKQL